MSVHVVMRPCDQLGPAVSPESSCMCHWPATCLALQQRDACCLLHSVWCCCRQCYISQFVDLGPSQHQTAGQPLSPAENLQGMPDLSGQTYTTRLMCFIASWWSFCALVFILHVYSSCPSRDAVRQFNGLYAPSRQPTYSANHAKEVPQPSKF